MTTEQRAPSHRWDLDRLYPGGAGGTSASALVERVVTGLKRLLETFERLSVLDSEPGTIVAWAKALLELERVDDELYEAWSLASCASSADVSDADAKVLLARMSDAAAVRAQIDVPIWSKLAQASDESYGALSAREDIGHMAFHLDRQRERAEVSMAPELEELQEALARDGFHSWHRLYDTVSGELRVEVDRGKGSECLSVEQARNLLESRDQSLREQVARAIDKVWGSETEVLGAALNHINGYRQTVYARRGIDELEIPLRNNRIARSTLETMFGVIDDFRPTMVRFLEAKAALLGLDKLRWFDVDVPVGEIGASITYEQAQRQIVEDFSGFSDGLGRFAQNALRGGWVEAEDRAGKRHGGFCTSFPLHQESRIFMTYGGTAGSVQTLAHELGHAYHSWVMRDLPAWQRDYPSTLAETASTFAESIVREAALRRADEPQVRLGMLNGKLTDAVAMLMNIPARYRFERAMYAERARGELRPERLSRLVIEAFDHGYGGALSEYERHFWASKLHFYLSGAPFYNFPYTVGFLFSFGLYARAKEEGGGFVPKYDDTLRLTGRHTVEDVAQKALGVDLSRPEFWQAALEVIAQDVDDFVELAKKSQNSEVRSQK